MTSATETQENEAGDVLLFYDSKLVNLSESSSLLALRELGFVRVTDAEELLPVLLHPPGLRLIL